MLCKNYFLKCLQKYIPVSVCDQFRSGDHYMKIRIQLFRYLSHIQCRVKCVFLLEK
jgi:hypothetical protein